MNWRCTKFLGCSGRTFLPFVFALLIGLVDPAMVIAQSSVGADTEDPSRPELVDELGRLHDVIEDELVGEMNRRVGTPQAARTTLSRIAPAGSRSLNNRAFWLSAHWTTGMGVAFAAGPQFEFKAPRSYFRDHARVLDAMIERADRGESLPPGIVETMSAGVERLRQRYALVQSAFFDCHLPGIGLAMRQEEVVDALLKQYRALPERPARMQTKKSAAWRQFDDARRELNESSEDSVRTCLGLVASAIEDPVFADTAANIADDESDRCRTLKASIDKLEAKLDAARKRVEAIKKPIEQRIERARGEIAEGQKRLDRLLAKPQSKELASAKARLQAVRKTLKGYEDAIAQLASLRFTVTRQLPRGARIFLAKSLFERAGGAESASDAEKREFMGVVMGGNWAGNVDDSLNAAVIKAKNEGSVRVAWSLAQLGNLVTKIPTSMEDILGTGFKDLIEGFLSEGESDPDFLDDPELKGELQAAPGQFKAQSAKLDGLVNHITSEQKRIRGLSGRAANDEAAKLIPVAVELVEEAVALQETLQAQSRNLEKVENSLESRIKHLEKQAEHLQEEIAALEDAIRYTKDEFIPAQERTLAAATADMQALEQSLKQAKMEYQRECGR